MLTFTQFLEDIRDKLGDYSGDPVQVMAARDVAEEDGLPDGHIDEWLLKSIFDQIDVIKKTIREKIKYKGTAYSYNSYLKTLETSLRSDPVNIDRVKSYLNSFSSIFRVGGYEDPTLVAEFGKLFGLFKKLKNKEVKSHFAGRGADYELHKTLSQIGKLTYARIRNNANLMNQYYDRDANIDDLQSFLRREQVFGDLSTAFGSVADYCRENLDSDLKRLFVRVVDDKNFMRSLSPVLQSLARKAASRMK